MSVKTTIERWQSTNHEFVAKPRYYSIGDFLTCFVSGDVCTAVRVNGLVTIYRNQAGDLIGCKVKGVISMLKKYESFGVTIKQGSVKFGLLFQSLLADAKTEKEKVEIAKLRDRFENESIPDRALNVAA